MPRQRQGDPKPSKRETNKTCDGTVQDYRRHSHRGETPCAASREAWRVAHRYYNHTGLYEERDPEKAHPFMYAKAGRRVPRNGGAKPGPKNRSKTNKDPRNG